MWSFVLLLVPERGKSWYTHSFISVKAMSLSTNVKQTNKSKVCDIDCKLLLDYIIFCLCKHILGPSKCWCVVRDLVTAFYITDTVCSPTFWCTQEYRELAVICSAGFYTTSGMHFCQPAWKKKVMLTGSCLHRLIQFVKEIFAGFAIVFQ